MSGYIGSKASVTVISPETDSRYVNVAGDTMTGGLTIPSMTSTGAITASGGVYLGGTGSSNLLDDYEEGTFTPVIEGTITAGSMTYSARHGVYTKIGKLVTLDFSIAATGGTGSGSLRVAGIPFIIDGNHSTHGSPQWNGGLTYPSGGLDANWVTDASDNNGFYIRVNKSNAEFGYIGYSSTVSYLRGCITYHTPS